MKPTLTMAKLTSSLLFFLLTLIVPLAVAAQDDDLIAPTRPGISEDAKVPKKGVVQVEYGTDLDFDSPDYRNRQSGLLGLYIGASDRLRIDVELETFVTQKDMMGMRESGIGDVSLGFKAIVRDKPDEHVAVGLSYSLKVPTASDSKQLGTGKFDHTARLILNRVYGKNDYSVNLVYLNDGREMSDKRDSGAQVVFAYQRELTEKFSLMTEYYGNTIAEKQPRGLYALGAILYKPNKHVQIDFGVRPGFGPEAPNFSAFVGITFGAGRH